MNNTRPFVILVDDDKASNFLNRRIIQARWPETRLEVFENGKLAFDYFRDGGEMPDVLLLDLNMPVWTGWDFLQAAKGKFPALKVVVLTSSVNPEEIRRAGGYSHVVDFWSKPLRAELLNSLMNKGE